MPELFELDDNRISIPRNGGQVAADLADLAMAAAELCPANAITLWPTGA
jgi:ferredoxin